AAKMAVLVETRDSAFARLIDRLERVQAIFDVVPGAALEKSVAGPGELQTAGQSYHAVVVPPGAALTRAIVARLAMLSRDGGTVIAWRPLPSVGVAWPDTGARFHVLDSLPELREALIRTPSSQSGPIRFRSSASSSKASPIRRAGRSTRRRWNARRRGRTAPGAFGLSAETRRGARAHWDPGRRWTRRTRAPRCTKARYSS